MERWWKACWFSVQGSLVSILNCNCLFAVMDSAEFAIRGFFLLVVFLIIKSMIETNFLNKFYFLLSPSDIFLLSLQMQSVERSCRNNHVTRRILNLFLGTSPAVCLHLEIPHHKALLRFTRSSRPLLTTHRSFR